MRPRQPKSAACACGASGGVEEDFRWSVRGGRASRLTQVPSAWTSISAEEGCEGQQGVLGQDVPQMRGGALTVTARASVPATPRPKEHQAYDKKPPGSHARARAPCPTTNPMTNETALAPCRQWARQWVFDCSTGPHRRPPFPPTHHTLSPASVICPNLPARPDSCGLSFYSRMACSYPRRAVARPLPTRPGPSHPSNRSHAAPTPRFGTIPGEGSLRSQT